MAGVRQSRVAPPVRRSELWSYGIGQAPIGLKFGGLDFLVFFYTQVAGLSGTLAGAAVGFAAVVDALSDPAVGALSDRHRSRWGRRHPFLAVALIPTALSFYLVWAPAGSLSTSGLFLWLLILSSFHQICSTAYYVPYLALGAELSSDYDERNRVVMMRGAWDRVGRALGGALILLVFFRPTGAYPDGQLNPEAYPRFAALFAVLMVLTGMVAIWGTRSRIPFLQAESATSLKLTRSGFMSDLREVWQYPDFRTMFWTIVTMSIGWGITGALGLHMMTYFWRADTDLLFLWGVAMTVGIFVGLPMWSRLAARFDKKPCFMAGLAIYAVFQSVPILLRSFDLWFENGSPVDLALYIVLTGFVAHLGLASNWVFTGSTLADIADLDELTHDRRREGIFFGVESFGGKLLIGAGSLLAGLIVDVTGIAGLDPELAGPEVRRHLGLAYGGVVGALILASIAFLSRYGITRSRHAEIRKALDRRRATREETEGTEAGA